MLERLFRRTSCPIPGPGQRSARARPRHFMPLLGFLIPSAVIAYGFVLPRAGFSGVNELSIGFGSSLVGATVTYVIGVVMALRR
jgi:ABC-type Fe3+ transport system permease subunit